MRVCKIADVVEGSLGLFPDDWFIYSAAWASKASGGEVTQFGGVFIDQVDADETREPWGVIHPDSIDSGKMARFEDSIPIQDRVEFGAVAVIAAVLRTREEVRVTRVQAIGTRRDYLLFDRDGGPAGVIEIAGQSERYTSDVAARKRANVRKSKDRPARIGIVAFGGPELRVEVVA